MAKKTIRITRGLGAEIVAKEITLIKKSCNRGRTETASSR